MASQSQEPIFIYGGTFDPVHFGHLRLVENLHNLLPESDIFLIPSAQPPHREQPRASATHRTEMLRLAVAGLAHITVDERELIRGGVSYTLLTLQELKQEFPQRPLLLVMGDDALAQFHTWYHWQEIIALASLVVVARPLTEALIIHHEVSAALIESESISDLLRGCCGRFFRFKCPLLDISATQIRQLLSENRSSRFLLPDSVIKYSQQNYLYHLAEE